MKFLSDLILLHGIVAVCIFAQEKDPPDCVTPQNLTFGETESVQCSFQNNFYGVYWYNSTDSSNTFPFLVYEDSKKSGDGYSSREFDVFANGSLVINNVSLRDDHYFRVISLHSIEDEAAIYDILVHVIVPPDPPYAVVEGCKHADRCVLNVNHEGNLTCSVRGVRPKVELMWLPYPEDDLTHILFFDRKETSTHNGGIYNVSVTSRFKLKNDTQRRLDVECRVSGWDNSIVTLDKKVELHFSNATVQHNDNDEKAASLSWIILTAAIIGVLLAIFVICSLIVFYVRRQRKTDCPEKKKQHTKKKHNQNDSEEVKELIPRNKAGKRKNFEERLKSTYREMYTVAPVPFMTRDKCCIDSFFVHRCLEVRTFMGTSNEEETWKQLQSHHDIFKHFLSESSRAVLMGENGCGKSTLTLQMAYEWCEKIENTYMENYEIFILLNFMDLVYGKTFYEIIRNVLIPNSNTTTDDVQKLLEKYQTGLIIFHGYDKVQNEKDKVHGSIQEIIAGTMFKKFHVVVTTIQSVPENMDLPSLHIRLFHFNEREKIQYMEKNIDCKCTHANTTEEGEEHSVAIRKSIDEIKLIAKQNPLLHKLLELPIFFALFVNITNNHKYVSSVVGFLNKTMSFLTDVHAENKDNVNQFVEGGKKLARIAFDRLLLRGKDQPLYVNDVMSENDKKVLDRYIQSGVLRTDSSSSTPQKFRFCHDILLEWYAAKHVGISKEVHTMKILNTVNPNDFPNVFAFVCGLYGNYADRIIENLRQKETCRKEIPLICFLELEKNNVKSEIITNSLKKMMKENTKFVLRKDDTKIYQRCILLLDEIALKHQMGIVDLSLIDCVQIDKCSTKTLHLKNDLEIPILQRLARLHIKFTGQTLENTQTIFQYCAVCENLKTLKLDSCLLQQSCRDVPDKLRKREVTVEWRFPFEGSPVVLDFTTLTWRKRGGIPLNKKDYNELEKRFIAKYNIKENCPHDADPHLSRGIQAE